MILHKANMISIQQHPMSLHACLMLSFFLFLTTVTTTTTTTTTAFTTTTTPALYRNVQLQSIQFQSSSVVFQKSIPITTTTTTQLLLQNNDSSNNNNSIDQRVYPIPVILIAGFLGTGKTTTLQHLLQNKDNRKVGVIVNDVAAINIDSKLIVGNPNNNNDINNNSNNNINNVADATMIDLQNGCVCCSLADEFFFSIEKLVSVRQNIDTVVVELSGVSDPISIKNNWLLAPPFIRNKCKLVNVVTIVDAGSFGIDYMSWDDTIDRPNWTPNSRRSSSDDTDYTDDDMYNNINNNDNNGMINTRKVAELLAEQVEAADVIVLNKCDIATAEQITVSKSVIQALNKNAQIELVQYGQITPSTILGTIGNSNNDNNNKKKKTKKKTDVSHEHKHEHKKDSVKNNKEDVKGAVATEGACTEPGCSDPTHSHEHSHEHSTTTTADADACTDPTCTDPTHTHDHNSHSHSNSNMVSNNDIGIVSFVYKASRPFHSKKLMNLLNTWPVPIKDTLDIELLQNAVKTGYEIQGMKQNVQSSPFVGVLRSKGFCWFAPYNWDTKITNNNDDIDIDFDDSIDYNEPIDDTWRHDTAMYWSHAGRQFSISSAGQWWGTLSPDTMKIYFTNNMEEYNRIRRDDFVTIEFGDRRQEIVFIGTGLNKDKIRSTLDECLLTDTEMDNYRNHIQVRRRRQRQISSVRS